MNRKLVYFVVFFVSIIRGAESSSIEDSMRDILYGTSLRPFLEEEKETPLYGRALSYFDWFDRFEKNMRDFYAVIRLSCEIKSFQAVQEEQREMLEIDSRMLVEDAHREQSIEPDEEILLKGSPHDPCLESKARFYAWQLYFRDKNKFSLERSRLAQSIRDYKGIEFRRGMGMPPLSNDEAFAKNLDMLGFKDYDES